MEGVSMIIELDLDEKQWKFWKDNLTKFGASTGKQYKAYIQAAVDRSIALDAVDDNPETLKLAKERMSGLKVVYNCVDEKRTME
jgi:hypothetical protein